MSISFSGETKDALCALPVKNDCCRMSLLYGILLFSGNFSRERIRVISANENVANLTLSLLSGCFGIKGNLYESEKKNAGAVSKSYKITEPKRREIETIFSLFGYEPNENINVSGIKSDVFHCENCIRHFIRGAFLICGSVTQPENSYQLEFSILDQDEEAIEKSSDENHLTSAFACLLNSEGFRPHTAKRKHNRLIYFKESENIVDLLNCIGAQKAAFKVIDAKILKDLRNNANRQANCDTANIDKVISAAQLQIDAITRLKISGKLKKLSKEMTETAKLRLENPEASLVELAVMHSPPITKSGVSHRLAKLQKLADNPELVD